MLGEDDASIRLNVVVNVVEATSLERTLNLTLQILELTDRVVVALNLMDRSGGRDGR